MEKEVAKAKAIEMWSTIGAGIIDADWRELMGVPPFTIEQVKFLALRQMGETHPSPVANCFLVHFIYNLDDNLERTWEHYTCKDVCPLNPCKAFSTHLDSCSYRPAAEVAWMLVRKLEKW